MTSKTNEQQQDRAPESQTAPGVADVLRFNREMAARMRRDVDETDAGAVPGCSTECAKVKEENERLRANVKDLRDVYTEQVLHTNRIRAEYQSSLRDMSTALASLRADAEAVRAVLNGIADYGWTYGSGCTFTINCASMAEARQLDALLTRALLARRQEEGQTDNG